MGCIVVHDSTASRAVDTTKKKKKKSKGEQKLAASMGVPLNRQMHQTMSACQLSLTYSVQFLAPFSNFLNLLLSTSPTRSVHKSVCGLLGRHNGWALFRLICIHYSRPRFETPILINVSFCRGLVRRLLNVVRKGNPLHV
jgi:hypothetical protein